MRHWHNKIPHQPPLGIAVNLSTCQLADADLAQQVRRVLDETGLRPNSLTLRSPRAPSCKACKQALPYYKSCTKWTCTWMWTTSDRLFFAGLSAVIPGADPEGRPLLHQLHAQRRSAIRGSYVPSSGWPTTWAWM